MATVKVKGQGHLKTKAKVTQKTTKIAFLHNFYGTIFDPSCLFGVMSQFKGQRSRSPEGKIWCYSFLSLIIKHFGTFLALLNAGVTFRLTTILSDFDKMTCLCMGVPRF